MRVEKKLCNDYSCLVPIINVQSWAAASEIVYFEPCHFAMNWNVLYLTVTMSQNMRATVLQRLCPTSKSNLGFLFLENYF